MPSIFVWKATIPNPSKKSIRCYSGSNWVVEDNDYSSRSYKYLQQIVIPGLHSDSVITFLTKNMPQDWVGSELLEVFQVPYHVIRSDEYATLEHIGNWMRVIVHKECSEIEFTEKYVQQEWTTIQQWMTQSNSVPRAPFKPMTPRKEYHKPSRHITKSHGPPITIPSISVGASHTIDPVQVRQRFQEFYATCGTLPSQHTPTPPRPFVGHQGSRPHRPSRPLRH